MTYIFFFPLKVYRGVLQVKRLNLIFSLYTSFFSSKVKSDLKKKERERKEKFMGIQKAMSKHTSK